MKRRSWRGRLLAGVGLGLAVLSGCQTWTSGMTLPSGRYLEHPPQYIPQSPVFPLQRELEFQERANAAALGGAGGVGGAGGAAPLPPPVPPIGPGDPPPVPLPPP